MRPLCLYIVPPEVDCAMYLRAQRPQGLRPHLGQTVQEVCDVAQCVKPEETVDETPRHAFERRVQPHVSGRVIRVRSEGSTYNRADRYTVNYSSVDRHPSQRDIIQPDRCLQLSRKSDASHLGESSL